MFTRQIGWSGSPLEAHFPTNVSSDAYPLWSVRLSELSSSYLEMFDGGDRHFGGFVHRPWIYVTVAAIAGLRFGRRWPLLYAIAPVQLSVLAGLFFLSPISKTRLAYATYVLGIVAGTYLLSAGRPPLVEELSADRAVASSATVE